MSFLLRKPIVTLMLSLLFSGLILGVAQINSAPHNAFYAETWEGTWGGRTYDQKNIAYYLVDVPDGVRALQTRLLGLIAPDGQQALTDDGFKEHDGAVLHLWDGRVQTFHFEEYVYYPNIWSPDSTYVSVGIAAPKCDDCTRAHPLDLGVVNTLTGELRVLTEGEYIRWTDAQEIAWSPDGQLLLFVDTRYDESRDQFAETLKIVPMDGSQPPRILRTFTSMAEALLPFVHWTPDAKHIVVMGSRGQTREIWYLDVVTGKITFFYASPDYFDACWSPTTDHFIAAFDTGFTLMTPQGVPPLDLSFVDPSVWLLRPGSTTPCDWSPDGTKLLLIYGRNYPLSPGVKVIDFTARTVSDIYVGNRYSLLHPYWSADSRMLALKTYHLSRDPNDVYIYDMATLQPVLFQKELEFINWVSLPSQ